MTSAPRADAPRASRASVLLERCAELSRITADPSRIERVYLSPEHTAANILVARWMSEAGLQTRVDAAGNLWGRREGPTDAMPALVLGSHLDTVPDAGAFDGPLGVVLAIDVADRLRDTELPFALEVVAFSDEEGTRFDAALMGSQAVAGQWREEWWDQQDAEGTALRDAFVSFGLDPARIGEAARDASELIGYLEAHIEQGPILEHEDRSLGYVTSIAGARRFALTVQGEAGHPAGAVEEDRRDALVSASEAVTSIERLAIECGDQCLATVGMLSVEPGAVNVIPGRADFTLDLRGATDEFRDGVWDKILTELQAICDRRETTLEVSETHSSPACECSGWLREAIMSGIREVEGEEPRGLWSKAGHDAMSMDAVCDVAMLFIRCTGGVSHHPSEDVRRIDVDRGLWAFELAVRDVAVRYSQRSAGSANHAD